MEEITCDIDVGVVCRMSLADVQTIQAVAGLWKLAAIVLIIVSLIFFQKQIRNILDRLSHFRVNWGKAGISVNEPEFEQKVKAATENQQTSPEDQAATTEPESEKPAEGPPEPKNWEFEMILGVVDGLRS